MPRNKFSLHRVLSNSVVWVVVVLVILSWIALFSVLIQG